MQALRLRTRLDTDTIKLPNPGTLLGRNVEVIVLEEPEETLPRDKSLRIPGTAKGKITIKEGFENPLDEETLKDFYA